LPTDDMRLLFALPGLHSFDRGAEIAFTAVASELSRTGHDVTLIGSGEERPGGAYRYLRAPLIRRERFERFPNFPPVRSETSWEEASFIPGFLKVYRPQDYDVTMTCAYPFLNWVLRARKHRGRRPKHVFITQNGDWAARSNHREYRFFGCDGLVCINPDYFEANRQRYRCVLIPNGVDLSRFSHGPSTRAAFDLPDDEPVVLMVSALIESKMVATGIEAVAKLPGVHLAVAGDGPLREPLRALAKRVLPGRFHNFTVSADRMPDLYRSATTFLHLSRDESFGNVFVEAMASGIPTVAWDLPRTKWITGDTARLVRDGDTAAMVEVIADTIDRPPAADMIAVRAAEFSWTAIARQYADFLAQVTAPAT
jgi:glycosyltransferase involved in cell wall biosynthesis